MRWAKWCLNGTSHVYWGTHIFPCSTGVQQGDPLAPLLFSVGLHAVVEKIATIPELKQLWFLDDGVLRGNAATVKKAFDIMRKELFAIGLVVNLSKCELYAPANVTTIHGFDCIPLVVDRDGWTYLGSPLC